MDSRSVSKLHIIRISMDCWRFGQRNGNLRRGLFNWTRQLGGLWEKALAVREAEKKQDLWAKIRNSSLGLVTYHCIVCVLSSDVNKFVSHRYRIMSGGGVLGWTAY